MRLELTYSSSSRCSSPRFARRLTVGCSASLKGRFVDSLGKGQAKEFKVEQVELLGKSDAEVRYTSNSAFEDPRLIIYIT